MTASLNTRQDVLGCFFWVAVQELKLTYHDIGFNKVS